MDSFKQFQEPQLSPKDSFYSSLTKEDISEIDYTHAQRVFNCSDITDIAGYHHFYLLKVLKQPSQKFWQKILMVYFVYSNL